MTSFLLMVSAAWAAPGWFWADVGGPRVDVDADGMVVGAPMWIDGSLLASAERADALLALPEIAAVEPLGDGSVLRLTLEPGVDPLATSRALHERKDVAWCHPNLRFTPHATAMPDDPYVADQWHLENTGQRGGVEGADVDAEVAWALSTGAGALISIIDTGVQTDHPDLRVTSGYDFVGRDEDSNPDPRDGNPHGTAAAGVAAATGDNGVGVAGVAYDAELYGVRFIGGDTSLDDLYEAFAQSVDAGAWVLSNSWGFGDDCPTIPLYASMRQAFEYAEVQGRGGLGAVVVVSAGNGGCDLSNDDFQGYYSVVSVAASGRDDLRQSYSSYGDFVDIAAPSGGILTTNMPEEAGYGGHNGDPYYTPDFSGTSASAPVVSGVVALMLSANPRLTAADVRDALCDTAARIDVSAAAYDPTGWSPYYGCGRVDAGAAVTAVADSAPAAPVPIAGDTLYADRAVLTWEPAFDADGDRLRYELGWSRGGDERIVMVEGLSFDMSDTVVAGDTLRWWVRAIDDWGPGEATETLSIEILAAPEAPIVEIKGTCASTGRGGGGGAVGLALLVLLALGRRRQPGV